MMPEMEMPCKNWLLLQLSDVITTNVEKENYGHSVWAARALTQLAVQATLGSYIFVINTCLLPRTLGSTIFRHVFHDIFC